MQIAKCLDCGVDQALGACPRGDVVTIGNRAATHGLDLIHHLLGWRGIATTAVYASTQVVDHDQSAMLGKA